MSLPDALSDIVADFCGNTTISAHRRHSYLRAEIEIFAAAGIMKPSYIRTVEGFKDVLQFMYRASQAKTPLETYRIP